MPLVSPLRNANRQRCVGSRSHWMRVVGALGGFAGLCSLPEGIEDPVLVSGTDGVGTKLKLAFELESTPGMTPRDMLWAVPWALVGMIMAIFGALSMRVVQAAFGRLADRPVARALVAGAILSVVSLAAPILLFSGEHEIEEIVAERPAYRKTKNLEKLMDLVR